MSKYNKQSSPIQSNLGDAIAKARLPVSSSAESASASPPSNVSPPPLSSEQPSPTGTQKIGGFVFPQLAWSLASIQPPDIVLLHIAGRVLEIKARGKWEPTPPKGKLTLPQPFPRESHQAYFLRVLALTYNPDTKSVDYSHWLVERKFTGERAESVLAAIRAGIDLPLNPCRILNPQPEN
jgi:hypothetical protein